MNKDDTNQNNSQKEKGLTEEDKAAIKKFFEGLRKQKTREQEIWDFLDFIRNNP